MSVKIFDRIQGRKSHLIIEILDKIKKAQNNKNDNNSRKCAKNKQSILYIMTFFNNFLNIFRKYVIFMANSFMHCDFRK